MQIKQIEKLLIDIETAGYQPTARVSFDYDAELAGFLTTWGYNFCVQDDAFGVQIVVSDANHLRKVETEAVTD